MRRLVVLAGITLLLVSCTAAQQPSREPVEFLRLLRAGSSSSVETGSTPASLSGATLDDGSPSAPLSLLVFTNPSCPYCRTFQEQLLPQLRKDFGTGKLLIRTVIVPLRKYPGSALDAQAVSCAQRTGNSSAFLSRLFTLTHHTPASMQLIAADLKLNANAFARCLPSDAARHYAEAQERLTEEYRVTLVPTFVLNGETQTGLPDYADLRGWITGAGR